MSYNRVVVYYVVGVLIGMTIMVIGLLAGKGRLSARTGLLGAWIAFALYLGFAEWILGKGNPDMFNLICLPVFGATFMTLGFATFFTIIRHDNHSQDRS